MENLEGRPGAWLFKKKHVVQYLIFIAGPAQSFQKANVVFKSYLVDLSVQSKSVPRLRWYLYSHNNNNYCNNKNKKKRLYRPFSWISSTFVLSRNSLDNSPMYISRNPSYSLSSRFPLSSKTVVSSFVQQWECSRSKNVAYFFFPTSNSSIDQPSCSTRLLCSEIEMLLSERAFSNDRFSISETLDKFICVKIVNSIFNIWKMTNIYMSNNTSSKLSYRAFA